MTQKEFDHDVAIIGAGFSGMAAAIALESVGISNFVLLEKAGEIGGTWRDNQYPGACCDVPSHLYSFSFELNPDWSRRFSPAAEIHAYQQHVMQKYDLAGRTRCGFEVLNVTYLDGGWNLVGNTGEQLRVRYLISAIGALHFPHKPDFRGLEEFAGKVMHSAEWDKSYDATGKEVVVIGSAASAVQIVPQLAKVAKHVSVMQRTASYLAPRKDRVISSFEKAWFRRLPFIQKLVRWRQYWYNDLLHAGFLQQPGFAKRFIKYMVSRHLHKQVQDPVLREKLQPEYEIGCKRILLSDDFYPALQQPNVSLVTDAIDHFSEHALHTKNGTKINADLLVLATGFQVTRLLGDMQINGPDGLTMEQHWASGIRAHRSVAVSGFPNFFMMFGPNSGLGHSSIIFMIEQQAAYIARLLKHASRLGKPVVVVRPDVEDSYNQAIQHALEKTVWNTSCSSWYKDRNGLNFSLWPHTTTRFKHEIRKASMDEYEFH